MNTDDNERYLAQLAMQKPTDRIPLNTAHEPFFVYPPQFIDYAVKPVKGFDASTDKAERQKAKRARKLAKRLETSKA